MTDFPDDPASLSSEREADLKRHVRAYDRRERNENRLKTLALKRALSADDPQAGAFAIAHALLQLAAHADEIHMLLGEHFADQTELELAKAVDEDKARMAIVASMTGEEPPDGEEEPPLH